MNKNKDAEKLNRLADAFVEDLLKAPDAEVVSEAGEDASCEAISIEFDKALDSAPNRLGRRRLDEAKLAVTAYRNQALPPLQISPGEARRRIEEVLANDNSFKMTIAARKGRGLSDLDALSLFADLLNLGVVKNSSDADK